MQNIHTNYTFSLKRSYTNDLKVLENREPNDGLSLNYVADAAPKYINNKVK